MRLGGLRERKDPVDARRKTAVHDPPGQVVRSHTLFLGRRREHHEAAQRTALHIERAHRKRRPGLAPSHHDQATARRKRSHALLEVRFPRRLPPYVHPLRHKLPKLGADVLRPVVEGRLRAQLHAGPHFLVRARTAVHPCPKNPRQLDHGGSHAPAPPVHEDCLASLQRSLTAKSQMRRDSHQGSSSSLLVRHPRRRRIGPRLIDRNLLRERSLPPKQSLVAPPDTVALPEMRHLGPDRLHDPGEITADDKRQRDRHRDQTRADVGVNRVHRNRLDPHAYLPALHSGRRQFAELDVLRWASALDEGGFHRASIREIRGPGNGPLGSPRRKTRSIRSPPAGELVKIPQ